MDGKIKELFDIYRHLCRVEDRFEVIDDQGGGVCLSIDDIYCFSTDEKGRVRVSTCSGELKLRPSDTLAGIGDRLKGYPQFVRTHSSFIVNLDAVESVKPAPGAGHMLGLRGAVSVEIPVTEFYEKRVMSYLKLPSLDHVIPWNEEMGNILKEKLRRFEKDIRFMGVEELRKNFSDSKGKIIVKQLMGNIIWQAYNWIKEGKISQFEGNLRSFWYSHIKPVLARLQMLSEDQYKAMSGVFAQYTAEYRFFKYRDFGFADDNEKYREAGKRNPNVIVYAEKTGHWKTLEILHEQKDISIISLGGQPSQLSTEYFVDELEKVVSLKEPFYLFGVTDYDPAGWIIAESFIEQLGVQGITNVTSFYLILPKYFTGDEIELNKYPVPQGTPEEMTKVKNWLAKGGGIDGEAYGLEGDAMDRAKLRALFLEMAKPYLKEVRLRRKGMWLLKRYGDGSERVQ